MLHTRNNDQWHSTAVRGRIGKGRIFSWGRRTNTSVAITSTLFVEVATVILCSVNQASHMFALLCTLNRQLYKHHLLAVDNTALCTAAVQDQAVCTQKDTGY